MLSANSEATINVECLMEDNDFKGSMNRDTYEQMCEPLLAAMKVGTGQQQQAPCLPRLPLTCPRL